MCTAMSLHTNDHYFGRTLDLDRSHGEEICVMPRRFPLSFCEMGEMPTHFAMIGMATVEGGLPLFYEAANEHGLAMAGLHFPGNAYYAPIAADKDNIAPFEFIPWVLGQCKTVGDARALLTRLNLCDIPFSEALPSSPLHWMLSDGRADIVVEAMRDGLHIYENPVGVLTNNPPFLYQLANLEKYQHLRNDNQNIKRDDTRPYETYSQGLGAVGLPGDISSMSRFVRIAFGRRHSACEGDESSSVGQFFHLLSTVARVRGVCLTDEGDFDITRYTSCINTDLGRYYYTTYGNRRINCVDMHDTDLEGDAVIRFQLAEEEDIQYQNV